MSLDKRTEEGSLQEIAVFVHGTLFGLHSLGVYYNLRRRRYMDAMVHAGVAVYDVISTFRHMRYKDRIDLDKTREGL